MSGESEYDCQQQPRAWWQHNGNGGVYAPVDASQNKALPWIVFSWFLSGGALIGLVILSIVAPSLIDSRVEARVARAEALAELARKEASNAMDMVDLDRQTRKAQEAVKHER
jgi:hypothetical protein